MRTLYLHIGTHRTATSSIQAFLHGNFRNLITKGFLYPLGAKRHIVLANKLLSGAVDAAAVGADLEKRASDKPNEIHSLILSDEDICMRRNLSRLKGFSKHFNVKVVYALRRQDLWLESWYLQNVKWQWNPELCHLTLDEFLGRQADFHWIDYNGYVAHLEEVFGRENVIPYVFEKEQMPEGPVMHFCNVVGLTDRAGFNPPQHSNSSLSPLISEFMRCLPLDEAPAPYRSVLEAACTQVDDSLSGNRTSALILNAVQRAEILETHEAGNRALARRYFGRDELFQAPLPAPDAPVASMNLPADSYELMQEFVTPLVRELISEYKKREAKPPARSPETSK